MYSIDIDIIYKVGYNVKVWIRRLVKLNRVVNQIPLPKNIVVKVVQRDL